MSEFAIVTQTITNATAISKLSGDLDTGNFTVLEDEFNKLIESGIIGLVLDISGVDSFTSAGLGAIVNMTALLAERKGKLVVASPRPKIMGELEMIGLTEALEIVETAEQGKKLVSSLST